MNEIQLTYLDKETKRFLAATAAMQGLLACPETNGNVEGFAKDSVKYADALLAALDETK